MHGVLAGEHPRQAGSAGPVSRLAAFRQHRRRMDPADPAGVGGDQERRRDALAVLDAARVVVQRGWVQDVWYVLRDQQGRLRRFGPTSLTRLDHREVEQACLVGAVVHSAWQQSPDPERCRPALDALWQTLQESRGLGGTDELGRVSSPAVRAARVRDLTRWNDRPDRTREDVLQLLEGTIARLAKPAGPPGGAAPVGARRRP